MNSSPSTTIPVVLITGFGPFRSVVVNPSWEVAKALKNYLEWTRPIHIVLEQLQVTYDDVTNKVPEYWIKYNPRLVIHLGVAKDAREIRLETCACNTDYCYADNLGLVPERGQCVKQDAPKILKTTLPLVDICTRVQGHTKLPIIVSENAGRYLCEYIYYQSLFIDSQRTIFIHIPDLDRRNFTVENLAETIQLIIYETLSHVQSNCRQING